MPAAIHPYIDFLRDLPEYEQVEVVTMVYNGVPVERAIKIVLSEGYGR